jgi:hypothetical protein
MPSLIADPALASGEGIGNLSKIAVAGVVTKLYLVQRTSCMSIQAVL